MTYSSRLTAAGPTNPILAVVRIDQTTGGPSYRDALDELRRGYFDGMNTPAAPDAFPGADHVTQDQIDHAVRVLSRLA